MKLIPVLVPLCALLLPSALKADSFEGKVTMKITAAGSKDNGSQSIDYSIKEGLMRMDMTTAKGGGGAMIMDFKNHQMLILMAQQKMYMVQTLPDPAAQKAAAEKAGVSAPAKPSDTKLVNTGETETILGYPCTKYLITTSKGTAAIWATNELGVFGGLFQGGRRSQAPQEWEAAVKGGGFFPMRVVSSEGGTEKFRLEVTAVQKESLPDSLFAAPDGWRKFDLSGIMGGALQGAFPGSRPSGGDN
jgi:hypothetical protein